MGRHAPKINRETSRNNFNLSSLNSTGDLTEMSV
jgi:hypothetical protein